MAGAGLGLAAATKYTAGIVVLPLLTAAAFARAPEHARRGPEGTALAPGSPRSPSWREPLCGARRSTSSGRTCARRRAPPGFGKLGLDYDSGLSYYAWVLTWGFGWVPLAAALAGGRGCARTGAAPCSSCRGRSLFMVYMGLQERFFGRWLLPAFPALALLAGLRRGRGRSTCVGAMARAPRRSRGRGRVRIALAAQGLVLQRARRSRARARRHPQLAREWMERKSPRASKVVVEPIVPDVGLPSRDRAHRPGSRARGLTPGGRRWVKFPTGRTTLDSKGRVRRAARGAFVRPEDYERIAAPVDAGLLRAGRLLLGDDRLDAVRARVRRRPRRCRARSPITRSWRARQLVYRGDPYEAGEGPEDFNFDWSFDNYPRSYERPGPTVLIYRLRDGPVPPLRKPLPRVLERRMRKTARRRPPRVSGRCRAPAGQPGITCPTVDVTTKRSRVTCVERSSSRGRPGPTSPNPARGRGRRP